MLTQVFRSLFDELFPGGIDQGRNSSITGAGGSSETRLFNELGGPAVSLLVLSGVGPVAICFLI